MSVCKNKRIGFSQAARWLVLVLALIAFAAGCASYSTAKKKASEVCRFNVFDDGLKKKVWVGFDGHQRFTDKDPFGEVFQHSLLTGLQNDSDHLLVIKEGELKPQLTIPRLGSGRIDNFALAEKGRWFGLNAFVIAGLTDICAKEKVEGVLWFKENRYYVQIHTFAEVYDTETGAKIFDEYFLREIEIEDSDVDYVQAKRWDALPEVREALVQAAGDLSEKVRDALILQKWAGYIISVAGDRVIISSGAESGLKSGDLLNAYDIGEIKEGVDGHKFLTVGLKAGEVRITVVTRERSEAQVVSGTIEMPGGAVKPKP